MLFYLPLPGAGQGGSTRPKLPYFACTGFSCINGIFPRMDAQKALYSILERSNMLFKSWRMQDRQLYIDAPGEIGFIIAFCPVFAFYVVLIEIYGSIYKTHHRRLYDVIEL